MSRGKYNALQKLAILEEVSNREIGFLAAAKKYGINKTNFNEMAASVQNVWIRFKSTLPLLIGVVFNILKNDLV